MNSKAAVTCMKNFSQCNPNMALSYVLIENHNPAAARLAFFAIRDILPHDELTFDYCVGSKKPSNFEFLTNLRIPCPLIAAGHPGS